MYSYAAMTDLGDSTGIFGTATYRSPPVSAGWNKRRGLPLIRVLAKQAGRWTKMTAISAGIQRRTHLGGEVPQ